MSRLRYSISMSPRARVGTLSKDTLVSFVPMERIADGLGSIDGSQSAMLGDVEQGSYNFFADGDVLLAKVTPCFENGKKGLAANLISGIGYATSEVHVLRPNTQRIDPSFLLYVLSSELFRFEGVKSMTGAGGLKRVSAEAILNHRIAIEAIEEQAAIARFLDRETRRIDDLIAEKGSFIELLKEKRIAVITHAVTKGIDTNTPMKASGIDWIGMVPETWGVTKLGYLGRSANGINIGGDAFGSGYPFISYGDVYKNRQLPGKIEGLVQSSKEDRISYSVKAGDVLFTRTSETIDEVAFPSVAMSTIEDAVFAGFLIRFRPYKKILDPLFSKYAFQNSGLRDFFAREMKIVTRASLSQGLLQSMPIALPPLKEQERIGTYLEQMNAKFECLVAQTERSIELLKEKRSALITAAVTGKIDVRNAA